MLGCKVDRVFRERARVALLIPLSPQQKEERVPDANRHALAVGARLLGVAPRSQRLLRTPLASADHPVLIDHPYALFGPFFLIGDQKNL